MAKDHMGGSRICHRRGASLRNAVIDGGVKKIKREYLYTKKKALSQGGGGGRGCADPLHLPPRSASGLGTL